MGKELCRIVDKEEREEIIKERERINQLRDEAKETGKPVITASQRNQKKRPLVNIVDNKQPYKTKEEKEYLVCLTHTDGEQEWSIIKGRFNTYEYIKDVIDAVDVSESFVLVENLALDKRVSVYSFMKYTQVDYNDGFDIDGYVSVTPDEEEEAQPMPASMDTLLGDQAPLSMAEILNGNYKMNSID